MANKKINQLVLKTTIQSTDLFPLGDATTGQLYKKTIAELQAAIGGAVISVNGLVGTVVLDTDDIQELASPTNKYFTDARARAAISLTTTGNSGASTYSSSTGVLNVPTYTLAGLGGITAGFLSGGTGITYNSGTGVISYSGTVYTDSSIRALVSAGTGLSYNSTTGVFSYSGTVYTDASIRALISLTTTGSSGASTYNNTTGVLNVPTYTLAGLGGISLTSLSGGTGITYNSSTGVISYSGTVYTDASVRALLSGTAPITYNSTTGAIGITQATTSTNGYLSSTDWNTFNSKQNALTNPVTGTGTSGHVAYWNGSGTITGEAALFYDATNDRLGLGTTSPSARLHISGDTYSSSRIYLQRTTTDSTGIYSLGVQGGNNNFGIVDEAQGNLTRFFISSTGNIGINTVTPTGASGTTLEINGVAGQARLAIKNNATGSTSLDGLQFGVDSGGGAFIEQRGANTLMLATNGNGRIHITSGGNIGIGTTSPLNKFTVIGVSSFQLSEANDIRLIINPTASGINISSTYNTNGSYQPITFSTSDTERMRIHSNGSISIGNNQSNSAFTISEYTTGTPSREFNVNTSVSGMIRLFAYNRNSGAIALALNDPGGNVLIGTQTDNGEKLYVSGSIRATGSITANSDARLKKNIERIENALEKVGQISGYTYNTIYDEDRHAGVIAQEIDLVLPEIVNKGNDGLMGVEYGNISALLIEAIKDLKQRNEKLEAIVEGLSK